MGRLDNLAMSFCSLQVPPAARPHDMRHACQALLLSVQGGTVHVHVAAVSGHQPSNVGVC